MVNPPRLIKKWKAVEIQLIQASEFLLQPKNFNLEQKDISDYREYLRANELELAMLELADIGHEQGAKSGFWRRLQKAAKIMGLTDKVEEYECAFQNALPKNK